MKRNEPVAKISKLPGWFGEVRGCRALARSLSLWFCQPGRVACGEESAGRNVVVDFFPGLDAGPSAVLHRLKFRFS